MYPQTHHFLSFLSLSLLLAATSGDLQSLLSLKSSMDHSRSLQWHNSNFCNWEGVKQCINGRVTKLVLEHYNLSGTLDPKTINGLDQLRVLSLKGNNITGTVPDLSGLTSLKSLYLNDNDLYGELPVSLTRLHRLKVIVLSGNRISGEIPLAVVSLQRLYVFYLENNRLTGEIPALNQTSLRYFNLSNNLLSGQIPVTGALVRFNLSSFAGNIALCGEQIGNPCTTVGSSPSYNPTVQKHHHHHRLKRWELAAIITGASVAALIIFISVLCIILRRKKISKTGEPTRAIKSVPATEGGGGEAARADSSGGTGGGMSAVAASGGGVGTLVFCGPQGQQNQMMMSYTLEDLLKASAETLGRGTMGSTYKAVMESGFIVTVKRLKEARVPPSAEEFRRHVDMLGRLRHPTLVPIRAYFQAKEERLLVYDYFPNSSLFSLIHGSRASGSGKPLHWTSCLKIAEDLATGLVYIHQNHPTLTHGNLKSSNVLLGPDFESCLTDYGLTPFRNPDSHEESSASSLFYRAPECRDIRTVPTHQADVYSFGVILLELLTGKTPFQDLVQEHGSDIPRWVKSVREEETESGDSNEASEEKLSTLLNIAMACVSIVPENRPVMREVLRMVREARAEAQVSSNSSDLSPGRWSDTVQGLPREEHLSI